MQEKAMVADALNTINSSLKTYTDMISQADNQQLRSALCQMRNEAEQSQYELYTIAKDKNYYKPSEPASQNEINSLRLALYESSGWTGNKDMQGLAGGNDEFMGAKNSKASGGYQGTSVNTDMTGGTGQGSSEYSSMSEDSSKYGFSNNSSIHGGWSKADLDHQKAGSSSSSFRDIGSSGTVTGVEGNTK